ncbi:hypothetical protein KY289_017413 [Solanum tuberosum]|nr:hypothetical protein KY289_017413 [Solanum tuberosum]
MEAQVDVQRKNEQLKNEASKVEAKLKLYLEKLKELENLEGKDDDVVEVNSKASGADGDLHEKHLC